MPAYLGALDRLGALRLGALALGPRRNPTSAAARVPATVVPSTYTMLSPRTRESR